MAKRNNRLSHGGWRPGSGRPKLPPGMRRTERIVVSVAESEVARLRAIAKYMGYEGRLAEFSRHCLWHMVEQFELDRNTTTQPNPEGDKHE